jgi:hypothetical protein
LLTGRRKTADFTIKRPDKGIRPHCQDYGGDRSKAVFAACTGLVRENVSDEDIVAILLNTNYKISEHVYDQKKPETYAWKQAARARKKVGDIRTKISDPRLEDALAAP